MSRAGLRRLCLLVPVALALAGNAQAISISGVTITKLAGNQADTLTNNLTTFYEFKSTTTVLDSGGSAPDVLGSTVDAKTRYAWVQGRDISVGSSNTSATSDYQVTFTVTAPNWAIYDLTISTLRFGALTTVDDIFLGGSSGATLGAITGQIGGSPNANLGAANASVGANSNNPINQSNTLVLPGLSGTNSFTLRFTWTQNVNSSPEEAAARFGIAGTAPSSGSMTADDYPGAGSRTAANDGHFVTISALMLVPEPGTLLLLCGGLTGLAVHRRRLV